jgi:hypothetical protein
MLTGALALLTACSGGAKLENEPAVRQALERYLSSRPNLNMQGMDLQIAGIQFRGQQAQVDVVFKAKGGGDTPGGTMSMRYTLNRRGDQWEVEPQSSAHGGAAPPAPSSAPAEMPPGHPPVKKP